LFMSACLLAHVWQARVRVKPLSQQPGAYSASRLARTKPEPTKQKSRSVSRAAFA
jgi:hypothetical protein